MRPSPVIPVPEPNIAAIKLFVSRQIWALICLQLHTGARIGELVKLGAIDIDTSRQTWIYQPDDHKNIFRDHTRTIAIGPKGREILRPFMADRAVDSYLFDPREAESERRKRQAAVRVTPLSRGNRPGSNRTAEPKRPPAACYTVTAVRRAISRACKRAKVPSWHPHQLRHNTATTIRRESGVDVSGTTLGHRSLSTTELYAEQDIAAAIAAIEKIG